MNAYRRLLKSYTDMAAVYEYDNRHSRHNGLPKWQVLKRIEELGFVRVDEIREELDRTFPIWHQIIVDPLAQRICRKLYPDRFVDGESGPPMGLCSRVHVSFVKNEFKEWRERHELLKQNDSDAAEKYYLSRYEGDNTLGISIVPSDLTEGLLGITDYTVDMKSFSRGTIGAMNGMNHPVIHIPISASLEWFKAQITRLNVRR